MIGCGCSCGVQIMVRAEVHSFTTIFKKAEEALSQHKEAVLKLARRKNIDKYNSLMDFLFCEVFPNWKYPCFLYYKGKCWQLSQTLKEVEIKLFDAFLEAAVKSCAACCDDKISWGSLIGIFRTKSLQSGQEVFMYLDFDLPREHFRKYLNWKK